MAKQRPGRGGKGGGGGGGKRGAKGGGGSSGGGKGWSDRAASDARVKKMERYEDTLEDGGVDDFMFKRDQIMFNPQDESDDALSDDGEEVLSLAKPLSRRKAAAAAAENLDEDYSDDHEDDDEGGNDQEASRKMRKEKLKPDLSTRGRFGKAVDSDDEEDLDLSDEEIAAEDDEDEEDEEGWGRQYYSRPSTRREKEAEGEYDEKREEDRELEEKEVRRLQKKAAEGMTADDWGFDGDATAGVDQSVGDKALSGKSGLGANEDGESSFEKTGAVPVPQTTDPAILVRHMEFNEPVKLALAREWPHVVRKLEKTARGIRKLEAEKEGQLHKGLGWLHYQTLLTYASTLAFYIHLASLPPPAASASASASASDSTRPDLSTHPILPRLLQLKEGVSMLEDLDFAAGSVSDKNPLLPRGFGEDEEDELDEDADEELIELMRAKRELMARMQEAGVTPPDEDDEDEEDEDEEWRSLGLEEGELEELMRDAEDEDEEDEEEEEDEDDDEEEEQDEDEEDEEFEIPETFTKAKKGTKGKADAELKVSKKTKKADKVAASNGTAPASDFVPLEEPAFYSSGPQKSKSSSSSSAWFANTDDTLGDPTALLDADATDKAQRRRSLQFHTAKIASTANRREKARQARMSGDEDLPRRDRRAARDAALRKNGPAGAEGEDLDGREWTKEDRKRAREVRGEDDDEAGDAEGLGRDEAEGYYELIKRRKTDAQSRKEAEHEANQAAHFAQFQDESSAGGPRALTRAIEKNRGLTPRRSKSGRNPRVKKRQAYEKAKQKVGSQRAVFKGGQASLGGNYSGEKTGISTVVKSRKF